ncbi:hypothetical protein M5K25_012680 [Dendrobium thyrsiflorum]|uniref:Uncharacterized protein n=1 Tax=Dendrobium thyrsiflorum TaxID=117978 RepID=A0ABD0V4Z8_DENTH
MDLVFLLNAWNNSSRTPLLLAETSYNPKTMNVHSNDDCQGSKARVVVLSLEPHLVTPLCLGMDPEQLGRTLDLLVGQINNISQQLRESQADFAEFRRTTTDRFDSLERAQLKFWLLIASIIIDRRGRKLREMEKERIGNGGGSSGGGNDRSNQMPDRKSQTAAPSITTIHHRAWQEFIAENIKVNKKVTYKKFGEQKRTS